MREEFGARDRSRIIKAVSKDHHWYGSKSGLQVEIRLSEDKKAQARVHWRVCLSRHWHEGKDITVADALISVGHKIQFKELIEREEEEKGDDA